MSNESINNWATPFRFEDLAGEPEPESWGPAYNIKRRRGQSVGDAVREAQAAVWKREPVFHTNSPSGQAFEFSAAKHRARLKAEFTAACNRERRDWADGKPIIIGYAKGNAVHGRSIITAYAEAMKTKRLREAVNTNVVTATRHSPRDAFRLAPKPHYVYRAGQWVLKEAA